nr:reverse transcriptase domain-containing protein [Tanacetum cinerariifolium]
IKNRVFNIGDRVLLFNSRLKIFSGKLKFRWSGPFTISQVYPYGTVELSQPDGPNFKVNGHRLKHYFGEDVPKLIPKDFVLQSSFPQLHYGIMLKKTKKRTKIRSKPDKNGKRVEAEKSLKQLQ